MKNDPTQSVKNQVKNYIKIREGLGHSLPFQHGGKKCRSCSCINSLVSFGFRGASLEQQLPKLRRKGYSCQCITHFGCCIKRKQRENIQVCVNVLSTIYRQVTDRLLTHYQLSADCRLTVGRQVAYISGKTCWPSVGQLLADRRPTVGRRSVDRWPTVSRQVFWGALLHNYHF